MSPGLACGLCMISVLRQPSYERAQLVRARMRTLQPLGVTAAAVKPCSVAHSSASATALPTHVSQKMDCNTAQVRMQAEGSFMGGRALSGASGRQTSRRGHQLHLLPSRAQQHGAPETEPHMQAESSFTGGRPLPGTSGRQQAGPAAPEAARERAAAAARSPGQARETSLL